MDADISSKGEVVVDQKAATVPPAPATETAPEQFETVAIPTRSTCVLPISAAVLPKRSHFGKQHITENGEDIKLNHAGLTAHRRALSLQPGENARLPYTVRREGNEGDGVSARKPNGLKIVEGIQPRLPGGSKHKSRRSG